MSLISLSVTGEDRIRFLHNQSTADFQSLKEGQVGTYHLRCL
jgi:folate-binding Fe-S cluster repair protein YgfZ